MSDPFLLSVSGTIILILLGVNGYFVKNLVSTVSSLKDVVNELRLLIETHKASTSNHESRLNDHSKRLKRIERSFAICQATNKPQLPEFDANDQD